MIHTRVCVSELHYVGRLRLYLSYTYLPPDLPNMYLGAKRGS